MDLPPRRADFPESWLESLTGGIAAPYVGDASYGALRCILQEHTTTPLLGVVTQHQGNRKTHLLLCTHGMLFAYASASIATGKHNASVTREPPYVHSQEKTTTQHTQGSAP